MRKRGKGERGKGKGTELFKITSFPFPSSLLKKALVPNILKVAHQ
jgi:hypothetical protein